MLSCVVIYCGYLHMQMHTFTSKSCVSSLMSTNRQQKCKTWYRLICGKQIDSKRKSVFLLQTKYYLVVFLMGNKIQLHLCDFLAWQWRPRGWWWTGLELLWTTSCCGQRPPPSPVWHQPSSMHAVRLLALSVFFCPTFSFWLLALPEVVSWSSWKSSTLVQQTKIRSSLGAVNNCSVY